MFTNVCIYINDTNNIEKRNNFLCYALYMRLLGIDVGTKRVGLAISDEEGKVAFPFEVCPMNAKLVEYLNARIKEKGVGTVVLGESKNFKGEDNTVMQKIVELKEVLQNLGVDVVLESETFTSQEAKRIQGNVPELDASAAAIILQSYLDKQSQSV